MSRPSSFVLVTIEPVSRTGSGAILRNHALLGALSRLGHVTQIAMDDHIPRDLRMRREENRVAVALPDAVLDRIEARIAQLEPDLVIVEGVYLAQIADRLMAAGHRLALDMHNVESLLREETGRARRGWLAPLLYNRRWQLARARESSLAQAAQLVMTCSECDARRITALADLPSVHVVPNPIPAWCLDVEPPPLRADGVFNALYVGYLSYFPNFTAAKRLARSILPRLRQVLPNAELTIAGRNPIPQITAMAARLDWVSLYADPPDLAPLYAQASCALIPLTEGGGTRLKVLEAMAVGRPVIATAKAVEGLGLVDGKTYLAAECDQDFVSGCLRLARSPCLQDELVRRGREAVLDRYGPDAFFAALSAALSEDAARYSSVL